MASIRALVKCKLQGRTMLISMHPSFRANGGVSSLARLPLASMDSPDWFQEGWRFLEGGKKGKQGNMEINPKGKLNQGLYLQRLHSNSGLIVVQYI